MLALLILSVGLAMDAFAVSLVRGSVGKRRFVRAVELGGAFGLAQGLMPLVGWALGSAFQGTFQAIDHWIALGLLTLLGGRMSFAAAKSDGTAFAQGQTPHLGLLTAAFATSIDAAAAGLTFSILEVSVPVACFTIGAATAILCTAGYLLGSRVSQRAGKLAEVLGGFVLIGLGVKILFEHMV